MKLSEQIVSINYHAFEEAVLVKGKSELGIADELIKLVCDACIQAITDNPHKSAIEAITDMRRKGCK